MEDPEKINFISTLIPFAIIVFIIAIGVVLLSQHFRKNVFKQLLEKESLKIKHQEKLLQTSVNVQEEERKRIAMDLHDELGAALSIGRMQLVQLEQSEEFNAEKIIEIRQLIESTLASTRRISHELMPLNLDKLGLEKALKFLCVRIEESGGTKVKIVIPEFTIKLPRLLELALYRIYSELINNTIKYADASNLEISIIQEKDVLFCSYLDDGNGLNENSKTCGLGFKSIESRVNMLKGTWKYGNRENRGFYAHVELSIETHKLT
ncbi:MAG: hypothetical protein HRT58_04875 [Crocinitomicaceae bacterium]|nr:histidine kinase [Flavobacteriales bacterium]NQZ34972.1 hypothetical protein [Crocinitomicaceae bacterium]